MDAFHEGERAVQARAGVGTAARDLGRGISRVIPAGAIPFLQQQRLAALAGTDDAGRVWASVVSGPPGFITTPDVHTLRLAASLSPADPLRAALAAGRAVGVLVLDPERRRRVGDARADLPGAERAVEVEIDEVVEIDGQAPIGWRFLEYSPFNPRPARESTAPDPRRDPRPDPPTDSPRPARRETPPTRRRDGSR